MLANSHSLSIIIEIRGAKDKNSDKEDRVGLKNTRAVSQWLYGVAI